MKKMRIIQQFEVKWIIQQVEVEQMIQQFEVKRITKQFEVERIIQRLWRGGEVKLINTWHKDVKWKRCYHYPKFQPKLRRSIMNSIREKANDFLVLAFHLSLTAGKNLEETTMHNRFHACSVQQCELKIMENLKRIDTELWSGDAWMMWRYSMCDNIMGAVTDLYRRRKSIV